MMDRNGSEEERNLSESMELCKITATNVKKESTDSKEECSYKESTEMSRETSPKVEMENSAESQKTEYEEICMKLVEVTSERNGAQIIFATDDFYGIAKNLLKDDDPVCNEHTIFDNFHNFGKNVDGWKTRKQRKQQNNFVIIELAGETLMHFICIDTACFIDSYTSLFSVQGGKMRKSVINKKNLQIRKDKLSESSNMKEYTQMQNMTKDWQYLIPKQKLNPGYPSLRKKFFVAQENVTVTHLRLNIYSDGGVARLRAYGVVMPSYTSMKKEMDLISSLYNSSCILFSDTYIGHPNNIIQPNEATSMVDGWTTTMKQRYKIDYLKMSFDEIVNEDWAIFELELIGTVTRVVIDTRLFTGNAPYMVRVQGAFDDTHNLINIKWQNIIPQARITPGEEQNITVEKNRNFNVNYVKIIIKPDGGICRFRVFGIPVYDNE